MHRQYRSPTLILTAAHCVHYQGRPKGLTETQVTASLGKPIVERIHSQRRSPSRLVARSEHSRRIRSLTMNWLVLTWLLEVETDFIPTSTLNLHRVKSHLFHSAQGADEAQLLCCKQGSTAPTPP